MKNYRTLSLLVVIVLFFTSCANMQGVRETPYFSDIPDSSSVAIRNAIYKPLKIKPGDALDITVNTLDKLATSEMSSLNQINAYIGVNQSSGDVRKPMNPVGGYYVDGNGNINIPLIGSVAVGNLTLLEAQKILEDKISILFKNPVVNVHFSNLRVTVLGEVSKPGTYFLASEKNNILDALGQAGDLKLDAKRTNLILIRDSSGHSIMTRFSLNSKNLVAKEFYYLQQNDIIYVEPNKYAAKNSNVDRATLTYLGVGISALSLIAVLINTINN